MKVTANECYKLFQELGFKTAETWDDKKIREKIKSLPKVIDDETQPETEESKALLSRLMSALQVKEDVDISREGNGKAPAKAVAGKVGAKNKPAAKEKAAPKEKAKKEPKEKKEEVAKDKFGNRVGTKKADFNAVLTKSWQSMAELVAAMGHDQNMYNHVNELISSGKVERNEKDGDDKGKYRLAK